MSRQKKKFSNWLDLFHLLKIFVSIIIATLDLDTQLMSNRLFSFKQQILQLATKKYHKLSASREGITIFFKV
ncbi:hypothetical protein BpHYR1_051476 [Brachionus plicatilis]|uniref:Uncharacterized protein n=1 Tax=Brachionus plicatilis TaxID=10195 RepID=A0A3M7S2Z9_BRAPC|nr:hypothetical protein BpHYR1_051476 [Brachionus plicatilis]